ncbi:tropomyosin-like [Daphnia pulex]|uniref:tropomyosin-like n=1 Tax=Daphnia pulex TaxID=6669 RepID=UPI001EE10B37|nr:tropomyosin-like [Daphnia pulex]
MLTLSDHMMDDGSDFLLPIPIFIPQLRSPSDNQTEFQQQNQFSPNRNEDSNRNRLATSEFYLQLTFNGSREVNRPSSIQLSSQSMEEEAMRCQQQLVASQQTLAKLEAEVVQLERTNEGLRSESEVRELMALEQVIKCLEEELIQCRASSVKSNEDLVSKTAIAKTTRTKRFETECALRELQLSICRRKLEYATAKALDDEDDGSSSDEDASATVSNLPEEEERISSLQKELEELSQLNNRALIEAQEAERLNANRQSELARTQLDLEQRISMGRSECEARRQNLSEKRQQLDRNLSYLVQLGQDITQEKLAEIGLLQQIALIEAAQKIENLERSARCLLAGNSSPYNG